MTAFVEKGFYSRLASDGVVSTIVGDRIYPLRLPQDTVLPAVTFMRITGERFHATDAHSGLVSALFQVDCWADTYAVAKSLAEGVRQALNGHTGDWPVPAQVGETVQAVLLQDERDAPQAVESGAEEAVYGVQQDYRVWYSEN